MLHILFEMHADEDTMCVGLLDDILEDINTIKEERTENFN